MRLQRLTGLEREKIVAEYREVLALIADLKDILAHPGEGDRDHPKASCARAGSGTATRRRTEIVAEEAEIDAEDLIAEEDVVLTVTRDGYAKRTPLSDYRAQRRGGKGRTGRGDEGRGRRRAPLRRVDARRPPRLHEPRKGLRPEGPRPPVAGPAARGKALVNLIELSQGERVAAVATTRSSPTTGSSSSRRSAGS